MREIVNDRTVGFYARELQICGGDFSRNNIGERAVQFRGERSVIRILLAKVVKSKRYRQVIGIVGETGVQVLTPQVLNDPKVPITVLLGWFDHRSFAEVIPGDELHHGRTVGHRAD